MWFVASRNHGITESRHHKLPTLLFPYLHSAERAAIGEMLGEEFAQQALMRARGGVA